MTQICHKCGKDKELTEFHSDSQNKNGIKYICKQCISKKRFKHCHNDRNIKQGFQYLIKNRNSRFKWGKILGYTKEELISTIENQFINEMTWDNYGEVWSISFHIPRACYYFTGLSSPELFKLWSLKNIKVMYTKDSYKQKQGIDWNIIKEKHLFDILPIGDISKMIYNKDEFFEEHTLK